MAACPKLFIRSHFYHWPKSGKQPPGINLVVANQWDHPRDLKVFSGMITLLNVKISFVYIIKGAIGLVSFKRLITDEKIYCLKESSNYSLTFF